MFTSGMSNVAAIIFSALTFTVSIPSAIKVFNWLATMYNGTISITTPMLYALNFIFLFTIGGLTGLFLGPLSIDRHFPRYLLRRRSLPLCDDGWNDGGLPWRYLPLVAEDDRQDVQRVWGQVSCVNRVRRLQLGILATVRPWFAGYASTFMRCTFASSKNSISFRPSVHSLWVLDC